MIQGYMDILHLKIYHGWRVLPGSVSACSLGGPNTLRKQDYASRTRLLVGWPQLPEQCLSSRLIRHPIQQRSNLADAHSNSAIRGGMQSRVASLTPAGLLPCLCQLPAKVLQGLEGPCIQQPCHSLAPAQQAHHRQAHQSSTAVSAGHDAGAWLLTLSAHATKYLPATGLKCDN